MANPLDLIKDADLSLSPRPLGPRIILGGAVLLVLAGVVVWLVSPEATLADDCGDLAEIGPGQPEDEAVELEHGLVCRAEAEVASEHVVALGEEKASPDPAVRFANVRFFARAKGPRVVLALSGRDPEVQSRIARFGHLKGFRLAARGRLFDPQKEPGYRGPGEAIQKGLDLGGDPWLIFDPSP